MFRVSIATHSSSPVSIVNCQTALQNLVCLGMVWSPLPASGLQIWSRPPTSPNSQGTCLTFRIADFLELDDLSGLTVCALFLPLASRHGLATDCPLRPCEWGLAGGGGAQAHAVQSSRSKTNSSNTRLLRGTHSIPLTIVPLTIAIKSDRFA
jgi:hypothetical protein